MNSFFNYLQEGSLNDDGFVGQQQGVKIGFPENIAGKEAKEAVRFLNREGVFYEEIFSCGGLTYRGHFRTKHQCQEGKLQRSIRYWLLDYCLHQREQFQISVEEEMPIPTSQEKRGYYHIVTIKAV